MHKAKEGNRSRLLKVCRDRRWINSEAYSCCCATSALNYIFISTYIMAVRCSFMAFCTGVSNIDSSINEDLLGYGCRLTVELEKGETGHHLGECVRIRFWDVGLAGGRLPLSSIKMSF